MSPRSHAPAPSTDVWLLHLMFQFCAAALLKVVKPQASTMEWQEAAEGQIPRLTLVPAHGPDRR